MGVAVPGRIRWFRNPPEYLWERRSTVQPIAGHTTPNIGRAWYTGWQGEPPGNGPEAIMQTIGERVMKKVTDHIGTEACRLNLWERVEEWRRSE
jgi:hypothetical protein